MDSLLASATTQELREAVLMLRREEKELKFPVLAWALRVAIDGLSLIAELKENALFRDGNGELRLDPVSTEKLRRLVVSGEPEEDDDDLEPYPPGYGFA